MHTKLGESEPHSVPERLRALEQLKTDGLINEEEYNAKRKKILGELLVAHTEAADTGKKLSGANLRGCLTR